MAVFFFFENVYFFTLHSFNRWKGARLVDEIADEQLIQVMNDVYFYLVKIGANAEQAKDIVQDAIYKSMMNLLAIEPEKYKAWVFKAAIHLFYDQCRRSQKFDYIELDDALKSSTMLIEEQLLQQEQAAQIKIVLEQFPDLHKQLLLCKYELGWSYQQLAAYFDLHINTVKTYLARARKKFKQLYEQGGYGR